MFILCAKQGICVYFFQHSVNPLVLKDFKAHKNASII